MRVGRGVKNHPCKKTYVKKHSHAGCLLWRQNNPEVNYSLLGSPEGSVSRGNIAQHTKRDENRYLERPYRAGSLKAAAREVAMYKLDVVGVQEVRWEKEGTVRAGDYDFFYRKGNENHQLGTVFFVHRRIVSAVKKVEFVSDRLSYIVLRGRWRNTIL